jgi:hypothetical protein
MSHDRDLHDWGFVATRGRLPAERVIVDPQGELPALADTLHVRLSALKEERLCARDFGLMNNLAYTADLEYQVRCTSIVYTGAVILQLAFLRAAVQGRGQG